MCSFRLISSRGSVGSLISMLGCQSTWANRMERFL